MALVVVVAHRASVLADPRSWGALAATATAALAGYVAVVWLLAGPRVVQSVRQLRERG